jgi:hypothetical protein
MSNGEPVVAALVSNAKLMKVADISAYPDLI